MTQIEFQNKRSEMFLNAMTSYSEARNAELKPFNSLIQKLTLSSILDLGCGEGYLTKYLSKKYPNTKIYAVDISRVMLSHLPDKENIVMYEIKSAEDLPFSECSLDLVLSLASFHHILNKKSVFRQVNRILKQGHYFIIADVNDNTLTQKFFDEVVKKYCITRHDLDFLDSEWINYLAEKTGFEVVYSKIKNTPWEFNNKADLIKFVKNLLGLDIKEQLLEKLISKYFNLIERSNLIILPWQLGYYIMRKR